MNMCVKVLLGWEEWESCTLPRAEASQLIEALLSMQQSTVLRHPRVVLSSSRSLPKLWFPSKKKKKKFKNAEAIRAEHERVANGYRESGKRVVYPDGS